MNVFTIGIIFGIIIGIFITIVGLLIGAAAGPNKTYDEFEIDDFIKSVPLSDVMKSIQDE